MDCFLCSTRNSYSSLLDAFAPVLLVSCIPPADIYLLYLLARKTSARLNSLMKRTSPFLQRSQEPMNCPQILHSYDEKGSTSMAAVGEGENETAKAGRWPTTCCFARFDKVLKAEALIEP